MCKGLRTIKYGKIYTHLELLLTYIYILIICTTSQDGKLLLNSKISVFFPDPTVNFLVFSTNIVSFLKNTFFIFNVSYLPF